MRENKDSVELKLAELMHHEVTRAEFLRYIGVGLLSMIGIYTFLKSLQSSAGLTKEGSSEASYGSRPYGR